MGTQFHSLVGCGLFTKNDADESVSSRKLTISDKLLKQANKVITFNGRHFVINTELAKTLPKNALAIIREKVRRTNLYIEDVLDVQDQNINIQTPGGATIPLCCTPNTNDAHDYTANISWYHIRFTLNPEKIKQGLGSTLRVAGLPLTKQTLKVACYRSHTNLRAIHHDIWFDYDILNEEVCCNSGVDLDHMYAH